MKTAKIYYEGKFIYSVEITQIKTIVNAYQLSHNELVCAIVPLNHLIIIDTEKQSIPKNDTVSYWGGSVTNPCNNTVTVTKRQIDDVLLNTIDKNGRLE